MAEGVDILDGESCQTCGAALRVVDRYAPVVQLEDGRLVNNSCYECSSPDHHRWGTFITFWGGRQATIGVCAAGPGPVDTRVRFPDLRDGISDLVHMRLRDVPHRLFTGRFVGGEDPHWQSRKGERIRPDRVTHWVEDPNLAKLVEEKP